MSKNMKIDHDKERKVWGSPGIVSDATTNTDYTLIEAKDLETCYEDALAAELDGEIMKGLESYDETKEKELIEKIIEEIYRLAEVPKDYMAPKKSTTIRGFDSEGYPIDWDS